MVLGRVIRVRRRVVAPEEVAWRRVMVERRYRPSSHGLGTLDVLISTSVPPGQRDELVADVLRQIVRHAIGNDLAPESARQPRFAGGGG